MTRTELKNFAVKMRRALTAEWGALAESVAYEIFYRLGAMRFMEARGFLPETVSFSETDGASFSRGRFLETSAALSRVMPDAFSPLTEEQIAALPQPDAFWAEAYAGFQRLFLEENPDVRTLGWLYQFYHSEKKEEMIRDVKRGVKLTAERMLTATQIFTPEWISEFLVANTLRAGGKWYIPQENPAVGTLEKETQEEKPLTDRTFCDPACGSGNMLVAAYDVFFEKYSEKGVPEEEIPEKILAKNIFGMDIDLRMTALAAFSLLMKAREHDRGIFTKDVRVPLCTIHPNFAAINPDELDKIRLRIPGPARKSTWQHLLHDLHGMAQNTSVGVLYRPKLTCQETVTLQEMAHQVLTEKSDLARKFHEFLRQISFLSRKYDIIVTNPPYMGSRGMSAELAKWLRSHYPLAKKDLFAAFIVRNMEMVIVDGHLGFMTPFVWMFISSYKRLRKKILKEKTLTSLIQLEYSGFDGATVPICVFTLKNTSMPGYRGGYIRLSDFRGVEKQAPSTLGAVQNSECGWFYRADQADFLKIPEYPVAYWLSAAEFGVFDHSQPLSRIATPRQGCATSNNARFLRFWHEVAFSRIAFQISSRAAAVKSGKKWFPYNKGGAFRKWYGNHEYVLNWEDDGKEVEEEVAEKYPYLQGNVNYVVKNQNYYFRESLSWSKITSGGFSLRYYPPGFIFDVSGCSLFLENDFLHYRNSLLGCLNSPIMSRILNALAPTLNFEVGQIAQFPLSRDFQVKTAGSAVIVETLIEKTAADWDFFEQSWNFRRHPIFDHIYGGEPLEEAFSRLLHAWREETLTVKALEEENNRIFLRAYGLTDHLSAEVHLRDITLRQNPFYRYATPDGEDAQQTWAALKPRLLRDTVVDLISYIIGCVFGRYAPESPGLILADNQYDVCDFHMRVPDAKFKPLDDNILVISKEGHSPTDATVLMKRFMGEFFGGAVTAQNVIFLEQILGKSLSEYFITDFYRDHTRAYKNRPIYWMFSSPRRTFNVMIYAHRFASQTVRKIYDTYLAPLIHQKQWQLRNASDPKTLPRLRKELHELKVYAETVLLPLAEAAIQLDMDDGILANYAKMGEAVRKIHK